MAKFEPPTAFNFDRPTEWPEWKQRFSRYRIATGLRTEEGEVQVSALIYAMGAEAEQIFKSFTYDQEDHGTDYDRVLTKFNDYFVPKRNVIYERACFHQRNQKPGESAEAFVRALYDLAEHCGFVENKAQRNQGSSCDRYSRQSVVPEVTNEN